MDFESVPTYQCSDAITDDEDNEPQPKRRRGCGMEWDHIEYTKDPVDEERGKEELG